MTGQGWGHWPASSTMLTSPPRKEVASSLKTQHQTGHPEDPSKHLLNESLHQSECPPSPTKIFPDTPLKSFPEIHIDKGANSDSGWYSTKSMVSLIGRNHHQSSLKRKKQTPWKVSDLPRTTQPEMMGVIIMRSAWLQAPGRSIDLLLLWRDFPQGLPW